jgi:sigma-70-like protein
MMPDFALLTAVYQSLSHHSHPAIHPYSHPAQVLHHCSIWIVRCGLFFYYKGEPRSMNKPNKKASTTRTLSRQKNASVSNAKNGASGKTVEESMPMEEIEPGEPPSAEGDALTHYLSEIGQHPLLTIEQEQALARRMRTGDTEAYQHFVEANLRLAVCRRERRSLCLEGRVC